MQNEISSGAMLGIVLIALAAIIGLGFGVFAIAKNTANDGITQVQDGLNTASESIYSDFDQRLVTGTQVTSAYQSFTGKNTAILIATNAFKDKCILGNGEGSDARGTIDTGNGVKAAYAGFGLDKGTNDGTSCIPLVLAYQDKDSFDGAKGDNGFIDTDPVKASTAYFMSKSDLEEVDLACFINYNALLTGATGQATDSFEETTESGHAGIYFDTNCFKTDAGFATVDGRTQFNNISQNMNKVGMMEYVSSTARYQAYLLKDGSGTTMGVVFEQQAK